MRVNRTEPGILRALVRGSAERLAPVAAAVDSGTILPGWQVRVLDGNHLPASEKRLVLLREHRGAALPGQALVVYDPDSGLVTNIVAITFVVDRRRLCPPQEWHIDRVTRLSTLARALSDVSTGEEVRLPNR